MTEHILVQGAIDGNYMDRGAPRNAYFIKLPNGYVTVAKFSNSVAYKEVQNIVEANPDLAYANKDIEVDVYFTLGKPYEDGMEFDDMYEQHINKVVQRPITP